MCIVVLVFVCVCVCVYVRERGGTGRRIIFHLLHMIGVTQRKRCSARNSIATEQDI